ncbi:MAG: tRNA (cytidine(34)-2'-O)-methyltransferase [Rhodospirillales bacterium]|nr:tRNA (cytidine(34)-2'-O)-methyltransferase [Rhodospirillales bacterium]
MRLIIFEPDIPQNTATMIRAAACLNVPVDIIEPCGFVFSDKQFRRAGMDYLDHARIQRHGTWDVFFDVRRRLSPPVERLVLLTTSGGQTYTDFEFLPGDGLIVGRESAGVPGRIHDLADARVRIPMVPEMRSLNVAVAAGMVLGEGLRQTGAFP